jgi:hypothetical protein
MGQLRTRPDNRPDPAVEEARRRKGLVVVYVDRSKVGRHLALNAAVAGAVDKVKASALDDGVVTGLG